jgi:hypothetical protein
VRRSGEHKRFVAKVQSISYDCDLAVLVVDDQSFFKGLSNPITLSKLEPRIMDDVLGTLLSHSDHSLSANSSAMAAVPWVTLSHSLIIHSLSANSSARAAVPWVTLLSLSDHSLSANSSAMAAVLWPFSITFG